MSAAVTSNEGVLQQLNELFGTALNIDVIKSVAASCRYDIDECSNRLIELTSRKEKIQQNGPFSSTSTKKTKKQTDIEAAINQINKNYKVLVILRGLPGSGKSTLASIILQNTIGYDSNHGLHIFSTDDYFCQNPRRIFMYDSRKIEEAHNWNQRRAFSSMSKGFSPVIIDNTNTQMWEMKPYANMATDFGYILCILEPDTHWCFNDRELSKRNTHNVPKDKIRTMSERYEKNITARKLLSAYNLDYKLQKPPQLRLYPPPDNAHAFKKPSINAQINNEAHARKTFIKSTSTSMLSDKLAIDNINLMDFNDDSQSIKSQPFGASNSFSSQNSVDKILMHDNNCESNVLKPIAVGASNSSADLYEDEDLYKKVEQAWGIKETSLKAWTTFNNPYEMQNCTEMTSVKKATNESGTLTETDYFNLGASEVSSGFYNGSKVLESFNRDINYSTPLNRKPNVLRKLTLDKGCMTDDVYEGFDDHMTELKSLFPKIPYDHLSYWYKKCKGDLEWTIEFLLESNDEDVGFIDSDSEKNDAKSAANEGSDSEKVVKKKMKKSKTPPAEEKEEIKKLIESKIDIGSEYYSKHLLKIKNCKFGSMEAQSAVEEAQPEAEWKSEFEKNDEVISLDSDIDFDDETANDDVVELNLGDFFVSQLESKFANPDIPCPKGFQPVVLMPVALAKQLYSFYIESVYQQMENQNNVLEAFLKEDEEFAWSLQSKEIIGEPQPEPKPDRNPVSLKEIQDDQLAAKKAYEKEMRKWKNVNPDTLAAKLTKQKLFQIFPKIPQDTLVEVLQAHDNKYVDTVETLLASTKMEGMEVSSNVENMKEPPITSDVLDEMKEAQVDNSCREFEERREPTYYREQANKYLHKRENMRQKAMQYHQRGMTEVAQFYSELASMQTSYYDRANNLAAVAFLDEHSKRLQNFNTLDLHFLYVKEAVPALDVFLDRNINLLKQSSLKSSEHLQIITGRGNRSREGKSKIKPAVIARLTQRNIKYVVLNPGLLKVKVTKKSLVTSEIAMS
ncbi:unnamed protein product [Phyllotreta striolata]|uniref:NEDD4-binding protein 2-like 1 n=1 Tax=Phyllotreta striolata TaxID=444603 RepID=A0A9N9TXH1_PHYSR|nr:unnamed protein product [Phyllotreta striolata]